MCRRWREGDKREYESAAVLDLPIIQGDYFFFATLFYPAISAALDHPTTELVSVMRQPNMSSWVWVTDST